PTTSSTTPSSWPPPPRSPKPSQSARDRNLGRYNVLNSDLVRTRQTSTAMGVVIRTEGLAKRYGKVEALAPLDLEVVEGEALGYLGPNGAGKTTTLRLLLALARPTSGRAEIFGLDSERDAIEVHKRLAFVPGDASLWPS